MNLARGLLAVAALAAALAGTPAAGMASAGAVTDLCADPTDPAYGSHDCKVQRLRQRSFAVIAIVDSGINPYHVDFRLPADDDLVGVHPSEYIEGYPTTADRMQLSFDAPSYRAAVDADVDQWERAARGRLTWVDGTNIVGAIAVPEVGGSFRDQGGHGTGVASQAAGRVLGPAHPDVLLVAVRQSDAGVAWAAQQPWIDAISMSWSRVVPLGRTAAATWAAAGDGKVICAATGNLTVPIWFFQEQGPSWHVNVGAVHVDDRHEPAYSGAPADVFGLTNVPAAAHDSMTDSRNFAGTSGATPAVCGLMTHTIAEARRRLGDTVQGPRGDGVLAVGPPGSGPVADGRVTRVEVEDAVQATAVPSTLTPPVHFVRGGYGIVDRGSVAQALKVLFGEAPRPNRDTEDAWVGTTDRARNAVWGAPPP